MKKFILSLVVTIFVITATQAQGDKKNVTKVSRFAEGTALTKADVAFLGVISSGPEKSRGAAPTSITVDTTKFVAGQKLNKAQAELLNAKATDYGKAQKEPDTKTRGAVCYYLYCNGYGNCYYVYYYC